MLSQQEVKALFEQREFVLYDELMAQAAVHDASNKFAEAEAIYQDLASSDKYHHIPDTYLALARHCIKQAEQVTTLTEKEGKLIKQAFYDTAKSMCEQVKAIAPQIIETYRLLISIDSRTNAPFSKATLDLVVVLTNDLKQTRFWYYHQLRSTLLGIKDQLQLPVDFPMFKDNAGTEHESYVKSCEYYHYASIALKRLRYDIASYYFHKAHKAFPQDFLSLHYLANLRWIIAKTINDKTEQEIETSSNFTQLNYLAEQYGYSRALILRASHNFILKNHKLACADFEAGLKKYISEDIMYFDINKEMILQALSMNRKKIASVGISTTEAAKFYEKIGNEYFDIGNYQEALLYYSLALWNETSRRLYILRAHLHMLLKNENEVNYNLLWASRFYKTDNEFFLAAATMAIDRLGSHALNQPQKNSRFTAYKHQLKVANLFLETDYPKIGLIILTQASKDFPFLPDAYLARGERYRSGKLPNDALGDFTTVLTITPLCAKSLTHYIILLKELNQFNQKLAVEYNNILYIAKTKHSYLQNWYTSVLSERAHTVPTGDIENTIFLAMEAFHSQKFELATYLFEKIIEKNPQDCVARVYRGIALLLNRQTMTVDDEKEAVKEFNHCIAEYSYPLAYFGLGLYFYYTNKLTEAGNSFVLAFCKCDTADFDVFQNHETIIIECLSHATYQDKHSHTPYENGLTHFEAQNYGNAKSNYSFAIYRSKNDPESYKYYFGRSFANLKLGYPDAAYADINKALELGRRYHVADEEIIIFKNLFARYCTDPVGNLITKIIEALTYYKFGLAIFPTPDLYMARAEFYDQGDPQTTPSDKAAAASDRATAIRMIESLTESAKTLITTVSGTPKNTDHHKKKSEQKVSKKVTAPPKPTESKRARKERLFAQLLTKTPVEEESISQVSETISYAAAAAVTPASATLNIVSDVTAVNTETATVAVATPAQPSQTTLAKTNRKKKVKKDRRDKTKPKKLSTPVNADSDDDSSIATKPSVSKTKATASTPAEAVNEPAADLLPLTRLTSANTTETGSDNDDRCGSPSHKSDSSTNLDGIHETNDAEDFFTMPAAEAPPAIITPKSTLNAAAKLFVPPPMAFTLENLLKYMPKHCELYDIERSFINEINRLEERFETYIVGGSLTDRVIEQYKKNLRAIPNPPIELEAYLNRPMFNRTLVVDDLDMFSTVPLKYIEQIGKTLGLDALKRRKTNTESEPELTPPVQFISFIKHGLKNFKVDMVYEASINLAEQASKRDSGLAMIQDGTVIDISGFGFADLARGIVRLTLEPFKHYHIPVLKLMHVIHTSNKRHLTIHHYEAIKQCAWQAMLMQPSFLNSALRKLFVADRIIKNYDDLHHLNVFIHLYGQDISSKIYADAVWIKSQLLKLAAPSLQSPLYYYHSLFIVSYVMQNTIANSNAHSHNVRLIKAYLDDENILQTCYAIINSIPMLKDAFDNAESSMITLFLQKCITDWKTTNKVEAWVDRLALKTMQAIADRHRPAHVSPPPIIAGNPYGQAELINRHGYLKQPSMRRSHSADADATASQQCTSEPRPSGSGCF
jgi:tetratricopeptide (TPR) repeat protein